MGSTDPKCPNCDVLEARIEEKQSFIDALLAQSSTVSVPNLPEPEFEGNSALEELAGNVDADDLTPEQELVLEGAIRGWRSVHGGGVYDGCVVTPKTEEEETADASA